ncbi:hypothetical protein D9611_013749 [Ephemerocybe angulata]|uniref:Uncharacterized protein n=1 Tax=Ephemerocybe angulata TaxID=980116 RepID=A0A8H5BC57_9AGAR|nr:hypothetical protein D9611_013749 [Tulosesus angulatus]
MRYLGEISNGEYLTSPFVPLLRPHRNSNYQPAPPISALDRELGYACTWAIRPSETAIQKLNATEYIAVVKSACEHMHLNIIFTAPLLGIILQNIVIPILACRLLLNVRQRTAETSETGVSTIIFDPPFYLGDVSDDEDDLTEKSLKLKAARFPGLGRLDVDEVEITRK